MMLLSTVPSVAATPVVIDTFVGDISESVLTFTEDPVNGTLSVEVPRGATVLDASFDMEGIPGYQSLETQLDFTNGVVGKTVWAYHKGDAGIYPPKVDPYNSGWTHANKKEIIKLAPSDGEYWQTMTTVQGRPPPAPPTEWPIQLSHFNPGVAGVDSIFISWTGHGWCQLNRTTPNHVEMWLYNHTGTKWEKVKNHTSANVKDTFINFTAKTPTPYLSTNGSIDVAMVGSVSLTAGNMIANGELNTDYIEVKVATATTEVYPYDITLEIGGRNVTNYVNYLTGKITIDSSDGLVQALQDAIDQATVMPGNITVPLNISLPTPLSASIRVNNLNIEYEPVVNMAPEWVGPTTVDVDEDASWTQVIDLDSTFTDDHNQGDLSFQVLSISDPANLSAKLGTDGSGNLTLEVQGFNDFFGQVDVVVRATDLFGSFVDSETITINVLQTADSPVLDHPGSLAVNEGEPLTHTFTLTDVDLPDDVHAFSDDTDLFDVDAVTGSFTWTPGTTEVGTHNIRITVQDRFGLSDTIQVSVVVTDVNQPPVITSSLTIDAVQGDNVVYTIRAEDPDIPFGDILTFAAFADTMEVTVDPQTGYMTFTPTNDQVPMVEITMRVEDSHFQRVEATLVVTVENRNDAPTLQSLGPLLFKQGDQVSIQLVADDPDLQLDLGEPEVLTFETVGPEMMVADANGLIEFTPDQSMVGDHTVSYTVRDAAGAKVSITVLWTIEDVNDPPEVTTVVTGGVTAEEDQQFILDLEAVDPEKDALEWSDDSDMFEIDPSTGRIVFTPTQADVGTHTVTVVVGDGILTASVTFDLVVENVNDAPSIASVEPLTGTKVKAGKVTFMATATDEDGDTLTYTWKEGEKVLATGNAPEAVKLGPGKHTITLVVDDGTTSVTEEVELTVKAPDESPGFGALLLACALTMAFVVAAGERSKR
jgi:hypothetical protein